MYNNTCKDILAIYKEVKWIIKWEWIKIQIYSINQIIRNSIKLINNKIYFQILIKTVICLIKTKVIYFKVMLLIEILIIWWINQNKWDLTYFQIKIKTNLHYFKVIQIQILIKMLVSPIKEPRTLEGVYLIKINQCKTLAEAYLINLKTRSNQIYSILGVNHKQLVDCLILVVIQVGDFSINLVPIPIRVEVYLTKRNH